MTGPFEPFEGRGGLWAQALGESVQLDGFAGRGEAFRISETTFKSYPSQIHTQGPIALALELRPRVAAAEIESIRIHAYQVAASTAATEPEKWAPKTRETADHSIPYLVAVALQDGAVTSNSFTKQRIQDPAIEMLIAKMAIHEDEQFTRSYPEEFNCRMELTDRSGGSYTAHTAYPKGHRSNPMSDAEVEAKFRSLCSGTLTSSQCEQVLENAWSLDSSPDLNELFDSLVV